MISFSPPGPRVDRLIVHQHDPSRPSPGGIDTCLRGINRYFPADVSVAVVGVDTGSGPRGRQIGQWEKHQAEGGRAFWFLPVVALDPADQKRTVPHSLRLMAGLARHLGRIPEAGLVQVHRMDSALALRLLLRAPQAYFIHTQENGLTGKTSDSFWRFAGRLHQRLERTVVEHARSVVVFNRDYGQLVQRWNERAVFSPTWFDPQLIEAEPPARDPHQILWVGRFEVPKDPRLAVDAFVQLVEQDPDAPWALDMIGSGTLLDAVRRHVATLPAAVRDRILLPGGVSPAEVAHRMARSGVFLMTSHPGYEGYARVLVESMASGLPAVVTQGSDTGGLVVDDRTGVVCDREPTSLAAGLQRAAGLDRDRVRQSVAALDAPSLIRRIFDLDQTTTLQEVA